MRRRLVRMHLKGDAPSISGFLRRGSYPGHYVLDVAKLHESASATHALEGVVSIPRENVLFMQKLSAMEQL